MIFYEIADIQRQLFSLVAEFCFHSYKKLLFAVCDMLEYDAVLFDDFFGEAIQLNAANKKVWVLEFVRCLCLSSSLIGD